MILYEIILMVNIIRFNKVHRIGWDYIISDLMVEEVVYHSRRPWTGVSSTRV